MASKRFQFSLNTSKQCFLCFKSIQKPFSEDYFKERKFSLNSILRYLKINLSQISTLCNKPASVLNKTEVLVSLCNDCESIVQKFTKHYEDLEVCRVKVESSLKDISPNLEENSEKFQNNFDDEGLKEFKNVKKLREKVLTVLKLKTDNCLLHAAVGNKAKVSISNESSPSPNLEDSKDWQTEPDCDTLEELKYILSTLKQCFLCLKSIQAPHSDNFCDIERRTYSLRIIFLYLGINLTQICSPSKKPTSLLNNDIDASLCNDCGSSTEQFTKHYEALEVCKMKVNSSLKDILTKLESNGDAKFNYEDEKSLKHSRIVIELRQKIITESKSKTEKYLPKIILQKIRMEKILIIVAPPTATVTEDSAATEPVFEDVQYNDFTMDDYENESFPEIESTQDIKPLLGKTARQNNHRLTRSCPHCGKKPFRPEGLNYHLITVHRELLSEEEFKKIKKHECHLCSKFFRGNFDLVRHLRRHTGDRPFSCSMCDKSFTRKDHLLTHSRRMHEKISSQNPIGKDQSGEEVMQSELMYHHLAEIEMEIEQDSLPCMVDPLGESDVKVEPFEEAHISLETTPQMEMFEENSIKMEIASEIPQENEEIVKEEKNCPEIELKVQQCRYCKEMFLWPDAIQKHLLTEHPHLLSPVEVQQMEVGEVSQ